MALAIIRNGSFLLAFLLFALGLSPAQAAPAHSDIELMVARVVTARDAGNSAPVISAGRSEAIALETAYLVQFKAVKTWLGSKSPLGFKAGLTSTAGQKKFAVNQPVAGVLLPGGQIAKQPQGYFVQRRQFNRPMMEVEIGFRLKRAVFKPITDIERLKADVVHVLPVIELPDLAFDQPSRLKGVDIIANNVVARRFIAGAERTVKGLDVNALTVSVNKDGKPLLQGQARDAMGDQWQALMWLINQSIASGWSIQPGQLLITGALGKMLPADAGKYRADFGVLGQIDYSIQ